MLNHPEIERYLKAAGLAEEDVAPAEVSTALRDLLDALGGEHEVNVEALYRYTVPMLSEDGSCSLIEEMDPTPYDLAVLLGGRSDETTRRLQLLGQVVDRATAVTGADWLGIYQRRQRPGLPPALVKLSYRGRASRAEFPLTTEFAQGSTNSTVGLQGKAKVIQDVAAYTASGGGFYVCDDAVQSEACLPILVGSEVVGILDAEAAPRAFFTPRRLAVLVAACLVAPAMLPT
jgi:L-methionine (R)-S-oxide reductase